MSFDSPAAVRPNPRGRSNTTYFGFLRLRQKAAVLEFALSGADRMPICKGRQYIFEISSYFNPNGMMWFRNGATGANYAGGQAFRLATPLNANPACDLALAATYIPEPATMLLLGLGGLTITSQDTCLTICTMSALLVQYGGFL